MMKRILIALGLAALISSAHAQSVQYSGSVTPNTAAIWNSPGVIKGGVSAVDSPLTTFGVTRDAVDSLCVNSARQTAAGRNQLCFQAATSGPAKISLQNYGTATPQDLQFVINGTPVTIPTGGGNFALLTGSQTIGHMPCFTSTTNVLQDCGVGAAAGTQFGVPYYSAADTLTSTGAAGAGQFLLGQGASAPLWTSLTGDVQTVSAGGALTLSKVNGIPFNTSYTAGGVLIGNGSSAFATVSTASIGQCLLSQGSGVAPTWSSCASGSGSAGGSNTQVQFNNSTALGGSVNMTWVNPALTLGVAGTTTGQLALASATATGTVTLQAPGVSGTYNFNMPTAAGSSGQPLVSGGGGSTPNSFGTLGVFGGGTNCSIASGTCLDNITGFSSTGFVFRSGAGTYTFANPIPVGNGGTGLANGTSGGVLAFTGSSTIASSGALTQFTLMVGGGAGAAPSVISKGTAGQVLLEQTGANPAWSTMSGDATINSAGALTIANSAVTLAKMANAGAYTLLGNFTGSSAAPQASTIGALTQKASPAASDLVLIQDQAASGQLKFAQVAAIASAGSVASIAGNTGAFTLSNGITNSTNDIRLASIADKTMLANTSGGSAVPTATNLAAGGASLVLVSCQTASASSNIAFTGLSANTRYQVNYNAATPGTDDRSLGVVIGTGSTSYQTSSYLWSGSRVASSLAVGTTFGGNSSTVDSITQYIPATTPGATNGIDNAGSLSGGASGRIEFYINGSGVTNFMTSANFVRSDTVQVIWQGGGYWNSATPVTAIKFEMYNGTTVNGTINSGEFCLYSYRNS